MRLEAFWIVCDPTPDSEFVDICWKQPAATLHYQIVGIHMGERRNDWRRRHYTIWTRKSEAMADASARLAARDSQETK